MSKIISCFNFKRDYIFYFDIEYDPSGNSNSSFHVRADILDLLFLYEFFYFFPCIVNAKIW